MGTNTNETGLADQLILEAFITSATSFFFRSAISSKWFVRQKA